MPPNVSQSSLTFQATYATKKKELGSNFAPKPKKESAIALFGTLGCIFFSSHGLPLLVSGPSKRYRLDKTKTSLRFFFNLLSQSLYKIGKKLI